MKRILHVVTLFLILSAGLFASQQPLEQVRQRLEQIKDRLQLTPEQIEQVRPILVDELQQFRAVQQKYADDDQNRRGRLKMARELRDVQSSADDKLKKILSKQQMDEMKKIREELRQERRERLK